MGFPKELTTVTALSKGLALSMFILLPLTALLIGYNVGYSNGNIAALLSRSTVQTPKKDANGDIYAFKATVFSQKNEEKIVSITSSSSAETLSIQDKYTDATPKNVYTFTRPGADSFYGLVYFYKDYGVANYSGGDGGDALIFTLNGALVTDSLSKLNPELKNWIIQYNGEIVRENVIKIELENIANQHAVAQVNVTTGKIIPGTYSTLK